MRSAKGSAENAVAGISNRDIGKEVAASIALPRDVEGRAIYFNREGQFFYQHRVIDGTNKEVRVDVYVEYRPNPAGQCTAEFPGGLIPVLIAIVQAAITSR